MQRAYKCLINKFPHTQASSFEMFLRWQRFSAPNVDGNKHGVMDNDKKKIKVFDLKW